MEPLGHDCCFAGQPGDAQYQPKGTTIVSGNLTIYETMSSSHGGRRKGVLVFLPDGFGRAMHNLIIADWYAKEGYDTLLVDYFEGDALPVIFMTYGATPNADLDLDFPHFTPKEKQIIRNVNIKTWVSKHDPERIWPLVLSYIQESKKERYPKSPLFVVGHCFGGKFALRCAKEDVVDGGVVFHPSNVTTEDFEDRTRPVYIGCAETDVFTPTLITDLLPSLKASSVPYHLAVYGGTKHGFASRAQVDDPVAARNLKHSFEDSVVFLGRLKVGVL